MFVFGTPAHPTWKLNAHALSSGRWLWMTATDGCVPANQAWVVDLDAVPRGADGGLDFAAAGDGSAGETAPCMVDRTAGYLWMPCMNAPLSMCLRWVSR